MITALQLIASELVSNATSGVRPGEATRRHTRAELDHQTIGLADAPRRVRCESDKPWSNVAQWKRCRPPRYEQQESEQRQDHFENDHSAFRLAKQLPAAHISCPRFRRHFAGVIVEGADGHEAAACVLAGVSLSPGQGYERRHVGRRGSLVEERVCRVDVDCVGDARSKWPARVAPTGAGPVVAIGARPLARARNAAFRVWRALRPPCRR